MARIAVILEVVYSHARGLWSFDWALDQGDASESLYFTDQNWDKGRVFAFGKPEVRKFLIDNAKFFLNEYHVDGFS